MLPNSFSSLFRQWCWHFISSAFSKLWRAAGSSFVKKSRPQHSQNSNASYQCRKWLSDLYNLLSPSVLPSDTTVCSLSTYRFSEQFVLYATTWIHPKFILSLLRKMNKHVSFPLSLDLAPFCSSTCLAVESVKFSQSKVRKKLNDEKIKNI